MQLDHTLSDLAKMLKSNPDKIKSRIAYYGDDIKVAALFGNLVFEKEKLSQILKKIKMNESDILYVKTQKLITSLAFQISRLAKDNKCYTSYNWNKKSGKIKYGAVCNPKEVQALKHILTSLGNYAKSSFFLKKADLVAKNNSYEK